MSPSETQVLSFKQALSLCAIITLAAGCSYGRNSILFATKTSLGVDIDSKPPTLDVGFARKEGTLSPRYDNGEVLPQMASFASDVGWFKATARQSFAVGDPAVLMAKYIGSGISHNPGANTIPDELLTNSISGVMGANPKPYFFYTDTSFAFKVNFGVETGTPIPDSFNLGYKRKELAYIPITDVPMVRNGQPAVEHRVPSLLATADLGTSAGDTPSKTKLEYRQFFATGRAANYLAANAGVRQALGMKIMQDADVQQAVQEQIAKGDARRADELAAIIDYAAPAGVIDKDRLSELLKGTALEAQADQIKDAAALKKHLEDTQYYIDILGGRVPPRQAASADPVWTTPPFSPAIDPAVIRDILNFSTENDTVNGEALSHIVAGTPLEGHENELTTPQVLENTLLANPELARRIHTRLQALREAQRTEDSITNRRE